MVTLAITGGALPAGLTMSSSGLISGTPTAAGSATFTITATDHKGVSWCKDDISSDHVFVIAINPRVIVTTESAPQGTVGQPYTLPLAAQMMYGPEQLQPPSSPLTWTIESGQLAPGLVLDSSTGVVSGTPTTESAFLATYKASLADGRADTKALQIVVRQPLVVTTSAPLATSPQPTMWEVGVPFTAKLTPSGGTGTYTFAVAAGSLPTGLALAADGTVVGKPLAAGVYRATLRLSDDKGRTADYAANFAVAARLAVKTKRVRPGKVGKLYRAKLTTVGGVLPTKWKATRGRLPRGIRLDRKLGVLAGTPKKPGRYRVTFEATDAFKVKSKKTLLIFVRAK